MDTLILINVIVIILGIIGYVIWNLMKKSEKLIRKIKEYRRRGKLNNGVPIIRDKIKLQTVAVEPDMHNTFSWLISDNNDDRILAGIVEVMRLHPRTSVYAVSTDINFQNKAEFSNIPFVEPPDIIN